VWDVGEVVVQLPGVGGADGGGRVDGWRVAAVVEWAQDSDSEVVGGVHRHASQVMTRLMAMTASSWRVISLANLVRALGAVVCRSR